MKVRQTVAAQHKRYFLRPSRLAPLSELIFFAQRNCALQIFASAWAQHCDISWIGLTGFDGL